MISHVYTAPLQCCQASWRLPPKLALGLTARCSSPRHTQPQLGPCATQGLAAVWRAHSSGVWPSCRRPRGAPPMSPRRLVLADVDDAVHRNPHDVHEVPEVGSKAAERAASSSTGYERRGGSVTLLTAHFTLSRAAEPPMSSFRTSYLPKGQRVAAGATLCAPAPSPGPTPHMPRPRPREPPPAPRPLTSTGWSS